MIWSIVDSSLVGKTVLHDWCVAVAPTSTIAPTHSSRNEVLAYTDGTCLLTRATASAAANAHVYFHVIHNVSLDFLVIFRFRFNHHCLAQLYPIRLIGF